jgi:hypothetical protein
MLTEERVLELKQKHGDRLIAIEEPTPMVFKAPLRRVWAEFQDAISKDKGTREGAYRRMVLACRVYPDTEADVASVFDDYPALPTKIGDKLGELVGIGDEIEIKKL